MLKLIPRYKQGNKSPDHDPNNPYHYHTGDGKKVVITPEDWEANVGKSYFKEIEDAVRAEQAAYPEPEYEVNPDFVRDLRSTYRSNMGNGYQNYRNFSSSLPQGYTFTSEGMVVDPQGNYYVQSGYRQSPRFTYSTDNPLRFTINKGKPIERNLTFYPINMDKRVKAPLPVDRVMDVNDEYEKAIKTKISERVPYTYTETKKDEPIFNFQFVYPYEYVNILTDSHSRGRGFSAGLSNALHKNQTDTLVYNNHIDEVKVPIAADKIRATGLNSVKNGVSDVLEGDGYSPSGHIKTKMVDREDKTVKEYRKEVEKARANSSYRRQDQEAEKNKPSPYILNKQYTLSELEDLVNKTFYKRYDPSSYKDENMYHDDLAQAFMRSVDLGDQDINDRFDKDASSYKVNKGNSYSKTVTKYRNKTRKEAEKEAIIHINPLEKVNTFADGGSMSPDEPPESEDNKIYQSIWNISKEENPNGQKERLEIMAANNYVKPYTAVLRTYPYFHKNYVISHSALRAYRDGFDHPMNPVSVSKYFDDSNYNLFNNNCSDATGEALNLDTKGLTTPKYIREQVLKKHPDAKEHTRKDNVIFTEFPISKAEYDRIKAEQIKQTRVNNGEVSENYSIEDALHDNTFATGGHLYLDGGPIKIGYAAGGKLKLIPRALEGIQFPVILQPAVADNTRYVRPYTSIEIAKSKKAYEQEQLQKLIEAAQERLPLLKADTRSTEQRQRDHNRAIQLEVKQKANELAANFGRALGANHDMTVDEVNQNTLNTANLMGYMVAPYLMTTLESGYYLGTGRPKEAAITAGIGYGLPALNKPLANVSNTTKAIAVSNRLKKGIKNTTLPAQEPLIDVNPIYNFIDNGTPFNGKLPLIGYVKGNLELFPNRPLILRPEKSYHTIDRAYLESSLPDFVKDSGLRNMLKQTYESISESTPSSELVTSINHTLGIEPKIPNDKFITGGVDKVKWLNDKPIFISKTPEEIYHPKFVRDAYKKPNEQVVDETYDIFRQRILDKFGIKLKENYDAKDIEDAFYSLETPTTDDFSKVMHNERWYNPDFNDNQKLFAEYFNQYFGLKNKNFVSYIDLKNAVKEGLQFGIDYLKSPGFTERATNMLNKYGFSYSPSDFKLNSRKVTWMPEFMNADSSLLFGLSSRRRLPFRLGGTATHEVFHWNPKFNTRINPSKGITLTKPADSPYYSNNYNNIPEDVKAILRPNKEKLIARELKGLGDLKHDAEISESYSDLEELRYNLKKEGIFDSFKSGEKFDLHMLDLFRKTKRGKTDRFIDLHNDDQIIKAVNEIAQNGNEEISYV